MAWTHSPRSLILIWSFWSFFLTLWDTAYVFLRPNSLIGGKWHAPLFTPMEGWAVTDRLCRELVWPEKDGFTTAQGVTNMLEATLYLAYFVIAWNYGNGGVTETITPFGGRPAAWAVLTGYTAGVLTATKTGLHFMSEIFTEYKYPGQNEQHPLLTLWGVMHMLYFSASAYMIWEFGKDIIDCLGTAQSSDDEWRNEKTGKPYYRV